MGDETSDVCRDSDAAEHDSGIESDTFDDFMRSVGELASETNTSGDDDDDEDLKSNPNHVSLATTDIKPSAEGPANASLHVSQVSSCCGETSTDGGAPSRHPVPLLDSMHPTERKVTRDIYRADASIEALSLQEVVMLKKSLGIETTGVRVPRPIGSFIHLSQTVAPALIKRLQKMGYVEPMPMQCQAIPVLLQGRNTILMGENGCGKTVSYLVPLIAHVLNVIKECKSVAKKRCAYCVIMALTREATSQIYLLLCKLLKNLNLRVALITTGYDNYKQVISGTEFLIVTPAKLCDIMKQRCLTLCETNFVVMEDFAKMYRKHPDEVDILLTQQNAMKILVSTSIIGTETLAVLRQYLKNSVTVKYIVSTSLLGLTLKWIACLKEPSRVQKTTFLGDLLSHFHQAFRMVIFANERVTVENIFRFVGNIAESVKFIHEEVKAEEVSTILEQFGSGNLRIVVATDILLKHVRLPQVDYVVHFDLPRSLTSYCGRIRVAHASGKTVIYNLLAKYDHIISSHICHQLDKEGQEIPRTLEQVALNWKPYRDYRHHGKDFVTVGKELKEIDINMRAAPSKEKLSAPHGGGVVPTDEATSHDFKAATLGQKDQCSIPAENSLPGGSESDSDEGRQYGIDDMISSDDESEIVPKRQIVKATGLIDLEKLKQRRLSRMTEDDL